MEMQKCSIPSDEDIDSLEIRWNAQARAFFVDYGNVRFSVTRFGAQLLADGLREAVLCLTVAQATGHEENNLLTYSEEEE